MRTPVRQLVSLSWYKITGTDPALNLKVTVEKGQEVEDDEQDGDVVLVEYGAKADIWHPILHQVNYLGQWRLAFAAARKRYDGSITNNVAIDDLRVTLGLCPPLHSCDFALDNCLWQNIPLLEAKESATIVKHIKANGEFEHHSCEFKMEGYPNADSESDLNGAYLISEWGNSLYLSPKISMPKKTKQACLSFFTCTTHASQTVRVFKTTDLQKNADMIGSFNDRIESKSCKWRERQVQVDLKENDPRGFWLVLHSYQDSSIGGSVIAIDDISLSFEACPSLPLIYDCQGTKTQISQDKLCDFHKDCPWGDDEVNCGYDIDLSGNHLAHWKRGVTGQSWSYTGSREMYVQLKDREYAIYESPEMKRMRYACAMTMRYTLNPMKGDLSVQVAYNGQERIEVYNSKTQVRTRGQTSAEDYVRVTFGKVESHLQVFIVATADKLGEIDAQISSIKFEDQCQYQDYDASATCKARYFKCKSGQCIGQTAVCNGIKECDDGSDESAEECPDIANRTCTFDDFCDFLNVYPSKQANGFTIYRGFHNILFGPTRDHTINSAKGRFAMISALGSTKTASLFTRNILSDCAHFVIKVLGDSQLTVNGKPITITHGQPGNWMYHYVEGLQSQDTLTIEAIVNGRSSYVAIDDFVWGRDCRPASEKSTTVPVPVTPEPTVKPKDDTDKTTRPTEHVIPGTSHIPADTEVHPAHRILWIMCMLFVTTALISGFIYRRQVSGFVSHQLSRFRKDAPIIQMDELAQSENPFN
ncbi:MAM and LDL-receptor class A domain-containing protein 2 [Halotydeus destructor]|nr:MAM and LDL-receptor class A domain-containing protein 2 [Halotydeus destructor]